MPDVSATDASRNFSHLLDTVEHEGATYRIIRHGVPVAQLTPWARCTGKELKQLVADHQPDADWFGDLQRVRNLLEDQPRWS
jgi:prevent-host-death family protein